MAARAGGAQKPDADAGGGDSVSACESKAVQGAGAAAQALSTEAVLASLVTVARAPSPQMVTGLPDTVLPPPWRMLVQGNGSPTKLFALLTG